MALRNIKLEGEEILRKKCKPVGEVTDKIKITLDDMVDTMRDAKGVGLAAPQIGMMRNMFVAEPEPDRLYYVIDPEIISKEGSVFDNEGCLSVPGYIGIVERPEKIEIKYKNLDGEEILEEFSGFDARVMCHEYDHLEGILYIDKADEIAELGDEIED